VDPTQPFWIGASDLEEGTYVWDDDTPVTFTHWNVGNNEPENLSWNFDYSGIGEDCVQMDDGSGLWHDEFCFNAHPFICEADPDRDTLDVFPSPAPLFAEDFSNTIEAPHWNRSSWIIDQTGTGGYLEVSGGAGELNAGTATGGLARAVALNMPSVADAEVYLEFRFADATAGSTLRVFLRGQDGWSTSDHDNPNNGYSVALHTHGTNSLRSFLNDTPAELISNDHDFGTLPHALRFQVQGSTIRARYWSTAVAEPQTWNMSATDTKVTTAGKLHLVMKNGPVIGNFALVDNIVVTALP
jgi:hypothetical protein